ncbi:hypothetical protein CPLU01_05405 [Colletotrichum plurivorum]|uniref:Uncharacterized protein n=1 Tax=Colletotrichum plurivorum TaxID=2175906 RepID=A0A8H6KLD9_9PEZI|nr:hypothetical protein CPLU01_05405 [Colletotrichum plurivorum]
MPIIIDGTLAPGRRYTLHETVSRAAYLICNPSLLSFRDVAMGTYLLYIAYVTFLAVSSLASLFLRAEGRGRWCPAEPPAEWGPPPPGWRMTWRVCFWLLRRTVTEELGSLVYEVFSWGVCVVVGTFVVEEVLRWRRARARARA